MCQYIYIWAYEHMTDIRLLSETTPSGSVIQVQLGFISRAPSKPRTSLYLPIYIVCSTLRPTRCSLKDIQNIVIGDTISHQVSLRFACRRIVLLADQPSATDVYHPGHCHPGICTCIPPAPTALCIPFPPLSSLQRSSGGPCIMHHAETD